jgi:hypothetical protein
LNNLNSDQLRQRLSNNTLNMNLLTAENDAIVKILAERGLKAVEQAAKEKSSKRCEETPLTSDELKAGGWWCADVSAECEMAFKIRGLDVSCAGWSGIGNRNGDCCILGYPKFVSRAWIKSHVSGEKQIHRIGNNFYWGAASDQAN